MLSSARSAIAKVAKRQGLAQTRALSSLADSVASLKGQHFISIDQLR